MDAVADMNRKQAQPDEEDANEKSRSDHEQSPNANATESNESSLEETGIDETSDQSSSEPEQTAELSDDRSSDPPSVENSKPGAWFDQAKREPLKSESNPSDSTSPQEQLQSHEEGPE